MQIMEEGIAVKAVRGQQCSVFILSWVVYLSHPRYC